MNVSVMLSMLLILAGWTSMKPVAAERSASFTMLGLFLLALPAIPVVP